MKANSLKKALAVITALTMMLIFVPVMALADEAFTATFVVEGGSATIDVFYTQDYTTADETGVVSAYVRNSDTGEIDVSGEGQLNFLVNVPSGYEIASVTATEGAYKNIKDQGGNIYRITKINGDLTVTVTLQEASGEETVYVDPTVTFSGDSYSIEGSADNLEFTETTLISDGSNTVTGVEVKIAAAGTYTFTGTTSTYFIVVKKGVTGVTLVLDGVNITSHATAAITCNKTSGVTIVAAAGSVNTLQDDKYNNDDIYTDTTAYPVIENAVIKTKAGSNVVIDGTGTINVIANGKNGVKGSADQGTDTIPVFDSTSSLTIQNVTLNVTNKVSDSDSIKDEATLNILSGTITVNGVDDAIKSDFYLNIGKTGTAGPTITVNSSTEGIEGSYISVYSGNIYVTASDDGINAANGDIADRSASFTYKQYGGYVYVNCTNGDAIDSNGSATFAGGTFEVFGPSQGDGDPIDTEYGATFSGATVLAVGRNLRQLRKHRRRHGRLRRHGRR